MRGLIHDRQLGADVLFIRANSQLGDKRGARVLPQAAKIAAACRAKL